MPRIDYVDEETISDEARALIESADETGAPDPRCVRIYVKNKEKSGFDPVTIADIKVQKKLNRLNFLFFSLFF